MIKNCFFDLAHLFSFFFFCVCVCVQSLPTFFPEDSPHKEKDIYICRHVDRERSNQKKRRETHDENISIPLDGQKERRG